MERSGDNRNAGKKTLDGTGTREGTDKAEQNVTSRPPSRSSSPTTIPSVSSTASTPPLTPIVRRTTADHHRLDLAADDGFASGLESDDDTPDLATRFRGVHEDFDDLSEQSDTDERVKPAFRRMPASRQAAVPEDLELETVNAQDAEDDNPVLAGPETTLVASDSTKTPAIKDDKEWKILRKKIIAEAKAMGFKPELSADKQTIVMLNGAGKEAMRVERQADKTLKLSSQPPTSPEQLIQLFLVTGSKTCNLKNAESPEVAAKLYQALSDKGIQVTISGNVLQQLSTDPKYADIVKKYSQKNPSPTKPTGTGTPRVPPVPLAPPAPTSAATPSPVGTATQRVPPGAADTAPSPDADAIAAEEERKKTPRPSSPRH